MGIMDIFKAEDKTEVGSGQFYELVKAAAKYEITMNGVNCNVPHRYIREMATGYSEAEYIIPAGTTTVESEE